MQAAASLRSSDAERGVARQEWARCLDDIARERVGCATNVTVLAALAGRDPGLPLCAIGYDPGQDLLEIAVGPARPPALRYFVTSPSSIVLREAGDELAIEVEDAGGARTFVSIGRGGSTQAGAFAV